MRHQDKKGKGQPRGKEAQDAQSSTKMGREGEEADQWERRGHVGPREGDSEADISEAEDKGR